MSHAATLPQEPDPGGRPQRAPARVLVVHNRYLVRGGEDAVVERETSALTRAGQAVETVILDNEVIASAAERLRVAVEAPYAPRGIARVTAAVERFRPDIVHVHNFFPLVSPAVHGAVRRLGCATVQTLHNFRITCANAMLLRDGRPCELCIDGSAYNGARYRCYRGSRLGSLAVARMIAVHRRAGTWTTDVDRFIALTEFARGRFLRAGVPADRIRVRPNGLPDPGRPGYGPRSGVLFVGRLSAEKGLEILAAAAGLSRARISVIGDGPLAGALQGAPGLALLGSMGRGEVHRAMAAAAAVVVPSLWYEGLPMVIAEAFAAGTPVVASKIGALAHLVEDGVTGLHAAPGDAADLARALDRMVDDPEAARRMGRAAREAYERDWAEDVTTAALIDIYGEAMAARAAQGFSG